MCLGVPGQITRIDPNPLGMTMGRVNFSGIQKDVCLAYVPEANVDDYAVIHVGFAISLLSEEEAMATLETLREIADLEEELGPEVGIERERQ